VEKIRTFFAGFAGKVTPLLLLDYDGTLAPFRVDRFLARPWAGVRELLTRIQQQGERAWQSSLAAPRTRFDRCWALTHP